MNYNVEMVIYVLLSDKIFKFKLIIICNDCGTNNSNNINYSLLTSSVIIVHG